MTAQTSATYQRDANRYHELAMEIRAQQAGPMSAGDTCPHYVGCPHDVDDHEPAPEHPGRNLDSAIAFLKARTERPDRAELARRAEALEAAAELDAGWHTPG